jgi:exodeoxyribonuclease V alpha subunit
VVIPVATQHWPMLRQNLLYTGVTRGRRPMVLVAHPKAVAMAVSGGRERRGWSKLKEWLAPQSQASSCLCRRGHSGDLV